MRIGTTDVSGIPLILQFPLLLLPHPVSLSRVRHINRWLHTHGLFTLCYASLGIAWQTCEAGVRPPAPGSTDMCVLLASARSLACLFNMWYIYLEKEIYDEKSTNIFKHNLWYNFIFEIKTHLVYVVLSYAYIHSAPIRLTHNHIAIALNLDGWPQVTGFFFSIFYCLVLDCGNMRPYFLRFFFRVHICHLGIHRKYRLCFMRTKWKKVYFEVDLI